MGSPHITSERHQRVLALHGQGCTSAHIANETRLSPASVWRILRHNGLKPNAPVFQPPPLHESTRVAADEPQASTWHQAVRSAERRRVNLPDNILVGARAICRYMHISAINTLERWVNQYGFPAIKRPDGKWLTSTTAIDEWIWLAAELHAEGKTQISLMAARAYHATVNKRGTRRRTRPYTGSMIERHAQRGTDPSIVIMESKIKRTKKLFPGPPPNDQEQE